MEEHEHEEERYDDPDGPAAGIGAAPGLSTPKGHVGDGTRR